ncbi:hypothetical protein [Streptomyces sp. NPDC048419]|uniref:hypothetical protein n=1 Tax=Streptomyces sp. NPDC048419 TaxID=3365547 RepID=UPI0037130387
MKFLKRSSSRATPAACVPVDDDEDDEESARGGYLIGADAETPPVVLTEPIRSVRSEEFSVSVPAQALKPGAYCLLGGPGEPTCEVIQIPADEQPRGGPRRILRGRFRTIASPHPAGTKVTFVTAERIDDWQKRSS